MKKYLGTLLMILMSISMFSIGFASWTIVNPLDEASSAGTFESDDVIRFDDYITYSDVELLKYNKDGFVGDNPYVSTIKSTITVDIIKCKEVFGDLSTIQIKVNLKYAEIPNGTSNVDYLPIFGKITTNAYKDNSNLKITTTIKESEYCEVVLTLTGNQLSQSTYSFDLAYTLALDETYFDLDYKTPLLHMSYPIFSMSAVLLLN